MNPLPLLHWQGVLLYYLTFSTLALLCYGWDKQASRAGWRRVPETRLHLLALLGAWPGAFLAQRLFRHKTRKRGFRHRFYLTVVINLAALAWLLHVTGLVRL